MSFSLIETFFMPKGFLVAYFIGNMCRILVLFQTDIRSIEVGSGSMFGCIGGFAAPIIIELQFMDGLTWVPMTIVGVSSIVGG